uniref:B30.2/SPRY domain-containing protein n=1 Tax=Globodera rostochiensis TaxID=31243 RepID=A0A914HEU3_GLORO
MSISTESTTADITADSEWWPSKLAKLDPSEEMRLLHARIAQLKHQQTINSPTSSASFVMAQNAKRRRIEDTEEYQNKQQHTIDELLGRLNGLEQKQAANSQQQKADQKALCAVIDRGMNLLKEELGAKMEQYQKQQQQNIGAALTETEKGNVDHFARLRTTISHLENKQKKFAEMGQQLNALQETFVKMEEYQKQLQQKIDALTEAEEGNVDHFARLQTTISVLGKQQKNDQEELLRKMEGSQATVNAELEEQKVSNANKFAEMGQLMQKIFELQRTVAPKKAEAQNRWDLTKSHRGLTISAAELIVQITGTDKRGPYSVFAALPIPKKDSGFFYYEVTIFEQAGNVWIGLAPTQMPTNEIVGKYKGTYAYDCWGQIWGHAVAGCRHASRNGRPYIGEMPSLTTGDVIGCGINLATRQIIYTKNGERLDTTGLFVDSAAELSDLFPCVTLSHHQTKIEANFGPNFKWKFS